MVYYLKKDYKLIEFKRSTVKNKKYMAILKNKETQKVVKVHFGDSRYEHFKDTTGLGLYKHLDHNDESRRTKFRSRHNGFIKQDSYSPAFFSVEYLW